MSEPTVGTEALSPRPQSPALYWIHVARGRLSAAIVHADEGELEAARRECVAAIEAIHDALAPTLKEG
jgi:hypothetical protein